MAAAPVQLDLFADAAIEHNGVSFGAWVESLPENACAEFRGEECRWAPSCARDGCWRRECAKHGRPLYGIGPSARSAA